MTKSKRNCLIQKTLQIESAEAIAANFGNLTGSKPEIITSKKSNFLNIAISLILSSL